jgi:hypothetical protein
VEQVNTDFAALFDAINAVHIRYRERHPKVIALDLRTGAGTNRVVLTTLTSTEHFVPYRFDVASDAPPAPQVATTQGALFSANPNASVVVATSNVTPGVNRTFDFELHRMWDATITGGFFASTLRDPQYGIGFGRDSNTVVRIGNKPSAIHFGMGITYPDTHWSWSNRVGILLAAAVTEGNHFYVGPLIEPRSGINVSAGFHWGRQTVLQDGLPDKVFIPKGAPLPTTDAMKPGAYFMAGLDLNIFRAVFGGTPSVPR